MPLTTIKPELLTLSLEQIRSIGPHVLVLLGAVAGVLSSVMRIIKPKWPVFIISVTTCILGMILSWDLLSADKAVLFNGMMISDGFSNYFCFVFLAAAGLTFFVSFRYLDKDNIQHPEYYLLILFSTSGMMFMASSLDLVVMFISLELMSLPVYTLTGFRRADRRSNEAAIKYFILGGVAAAILLYGIALLYGSTGSTNIEALIGYIKSSKEGLSPMFVLGAGLVLAGFLFKVASVPFHMWLPDVYEGAPAPITGFMTSGLKAAAFAALLRIFISLGYGDGIAQAFEERIHDIFWVSAVLTMVVGNLIALTQVNLKRMLAYSSIAHSGYILVGFLAGSQSEQGYAPVLLYLVIYSLMNIGAFAVISILAGKYDEQLNLHDMSGIASRHPWLSFAMAIFLFSMAGIPPTGGFIAKYLLFYAAVQAHEILLVVIAVLCSVISVYYYLRILIYMYMRESHRGAPLSRVNFWSALVVAVTAILVIQIGILPTQLVEIAKRAVLNL